MFFGMVTPAFNTRNPYVQEDYMNVTVVGDWSSDTYYVWEDILASTDLRQPVFSSFLRHLYFVLMEVEGDDTLEDFAMLKLTFTSGGLDDGEWKSPNNETVEFYSMPEPGKTVKVLLIAVKDENPAP